MAKSIVFLYIFFYFNIAFSQQKSVKIHETFNEAITNVNVKLQSFIPKGYEAIAQKSGDLNLDKLEDYILVLRKKTEEKTSNYNDNKPDKRPVLLLLGQKNGSFKLAYKNENAAYCIDCGGVFGDPFDGISIKNGYFSIEHRISGGHHWEQIITFKFDKVKNNWFLYKHHFINYILNPSSDPNEEALIPDVDKLKTVKDFGEISFEKFNIYSQRGY
ncbi:hypothetical protein IR010_03390 [Flavobacterium sp. MR2016-29]|uniref:hypothetical protein n=1 Tax=Flavobacterium sp. MR2016-29 TaxID=2783795 RepID=UPI00188C9FD9|nr:hypothetical protein [Flavobacterium sp. MR2016-29]MBF4491571.1 hypothetical protein [Flavobacterium sp. MR2016-29]